MNRKEMEYALESCEFFELLGKDEISEIAGLCQVNTYKTSEYVFQQGDHGEYLYIIAQGYIYLERSMDLGKHKGNIVIEALGKGRVLGCWSTLLDIPHTLMSSAICQKPTQVIVFKGNDLRRLMEKEASLGFYMCERLCFLLRDRIEHAYGALEKI